MPGTLGARIFKVHVQVGDFDPGTRPGLGLPPTGTPVIVHAGSGAARCTHRPAGILARHPRLTAIVAHLGTPEYAEFLALAERYDNVGLDTTMAFTDFVERIAPYPPELLPRLRELGLAGKVYFGSDFPNIPYDYSHQLDALARLNLGDQWLRAVSGATRRAYSASRNLCRSRWIISGAMPCAARYCAAPPHRPRAYSSMDSMVCGRALITPELRRMSASVMPAGSVSQLRRLSSVYA